MKHIKAALLLICAAFLCGCTGAEAETKNLYLTDPTLFYQEWDEAALSNIDTGLVISKLSSAFPEELNMETNSGLISPEAFTGPILCFRSDNTASPLLNRIYIPDQESQDYLSSSQFPVDDDLNKYTYSAERIPGEYLSDEKLEALKKKNLPITFAIVECTGYDHSKIYHAPSGSEDEIFWLDWRVSYYSYPDCTLLGWETAERPYSEPESMSIDSTSKDSNGKRVYLNDKTGSTVDVMDVSLKLLYGGS